MQIKNITNMKHEWADGCKVKSHGSDQVVITLTAPAGLFIFNLQHNFFFACTIFNLQVIFLVCMYNF